MYQIDLEDTKLRVEFPQPGLTRHVSYTSSLRDRSVKQEEEWRWVRKLGNGSFGEVWLEEQVKGAILGRNRAVKMISKRANSSVIDYRRELEAIAKFSKPKYAYCFVASHGWYDYNDHIFITMEYLEKGDLQKYLTKPFPESEAKEIASQIAEGLYFMHRNQYAHRDLKPANILVQQLEPTWWVKIGDFGISKRVPEGMTDLRTGVFTPDYMAPEIRYPDPKLPRGADGYSYTFAVDMWALGEICVRLVTHAAAFPTDTDLVHFLFMNGSFPPDKTLPEKNSSSQCQDFVRKLLVRDPEARLTSEDAIKHPWIKVLRPPSPTNIGSTIDAGNGPVPEFSGPGPKGMISVTGPGTGTAASGKWPTEFDQESMESLPLRAKSSKASTGEHTPHQDYEGGILTAASAQWPDSTFPTNGNTAIQPFKAEETPTEQSTAHKSVGLDPAGSSLFSKDGTAALKDELGSIDTPGTVERWLSKNEDALGVLRTISQQNASSLKRIDDLFPSRPAALEDFQTRESVPRNLKQGFGGAWYDEYLASLPQAQNILGAAPKGQRHLAHFLETTPMAVQAGILADALADESKTSRVAKPSQPNEDTASKAVATESKQRTLPDISDEWDVLTNPKREPEYSNPPDMKQLMLESYQTPLNISPFQVKKGNPKKVPRSTTRRSKIEGYVSPPASDEPVRNASSGFNNAASLNPLSKPAQKPETLAGVSSTPRSNHSFLNIFSSGNREKQPAKKQTSAGSERRRYSSAEFSKRRDQMTKDEANVLIDPLADDEDEEF